MFMRFIHDLQQTYLHLQRCTIDRDSFNEGNGYAMMGASASVDLVMGASRCCLGEVVFGCFFNLGLCVCGAGRGGDLFSHPSDFETSDFAYEGAGGNRFHINRGKRGGGKSVFTSLRFWNAYETLRSHKRGEVHELVSKRFEFFSAIFKHFFIWFLSFQGRFWDTFFLRKQFLRWGVLCFSSIQYCLRARARVVLFQKVSSQSLFCFFTSLTQSIAIDDSLNHRTFLTFRFGR